MNFPTPDLLRLHFIPALGPARIRKLIEAFKTPERLFGASLKELMRVNGFDETLAKRIFTAFRDDKLIQKVDNQLAKLEKYNARIITFGDDEYPPNLRTIYNAPLLLFVRGKLLPKDACSIAVVGSRTTTEYGRLATERIASELAARGITIVSGMAAGIDTCAHWAALNTGGRSVAVLGCGLDIVYPASNVSLYKKLIQDGAVLSEFGFETKPWPGNFPSRNRIISGMTLGTVIVEAGKKSGALITAAAALEQNREVFAVPGNISSTHSEGTNALIRDSAAKLVLTADDILNELENQMNMTPSNRKKEEPPPVQLTSEVSAVYQFTKNEPVFSDEIAQKSGIPVSKLSSILLTLELKGVIRKIPGNKYIRV